MSILPSQNSRGNFIKRFFARWRPEPAPGITVTVIEIRKLARGDDDLRRWPHLRHRGEQSCNQLVESTLADQVRRHLLQPREGVRRG